MMPLAVGMAVAIASRRPSFGLAAAATAWSPPVALGAGLLLVMFLAGKRVAAERASPATGDLLLFGELVNLGLHAGLPFLNAAERAAEGMTPPLDAEVGQVLRSAQHHGAAAALAGAEGVTGPFFRIVARAVSTGAPLVPAVASFVSETRAAISAERSAAAKRLPVRLLLPLTLFILPGFIVLTLGPALLSGLDRLHL